MGNNLSASIKKYTHTRVFTLIVIIILCLVFIAITKASTFFTASNIGSGLINMTFNMLLAMGMTVVLILGCVDLSVGAIIAFVSVVIALLMQSGVPAFLGVIIGIALGCGIGALNGVLVGYGGLAPFVATLGTQSICRGASYVLTSGYTVTGLPSSFLVLGQGSTLGISNLILITLVAVLIMAYIVPRQSVFKKVFLVGTSKNAAFMSGIDSNKIIIFGYAISGLFAGISGVLMTSRYAMGNAGSAVGYETNAIAASVIGGALMSGGEGNILGTALGVLLVAIINNAFIQFGGNAEWQTAISGIMLVFTLYVDVMKNKRAERKGDI